MHMHVHVHIHKHAANAQGVVFWSFCDNLGSSTGFCFYCFKGWSVDVSVENIYQQRQQMAVTGSEVLQTRLLDLSSDPSQNHQILG